MNGHNIVSAVFALACTAVQPAYANMALIENANEYFEPIPTTIPEIENNEVTAPKIELGKMLFMDPRLSASHLISCNTCHNLGMGGDDNLETSIGHGWAKGPRNAPTAFNAIFNIAQFWDGRAEDLRTQAKGPIQAGVEMNNTPERVVEALMSMPQYVSMFITAFPQEEDAVTFDNMAKAIEAFEATLVTPNSRFDQFLNGKETALNDIEQQGLDIFIEKGCVSCHAGRNIGGEGYYPFGVIEKPGSDILPVGDKGRFSVTKTADDSYVFRAAPLRNIEITAPYFHSGKVWDLKQAVSIMGTSQLGEDLNEQEINSIVAFLKTLTGEQPIVSYPILPKSSETTPRPLEMN